MERKPYNPQDFESIVSQIKSMKRIHPNQIIYIVMNSSNWINEFKCITSIDDCDIKVSPTVPDKEIILLPEKLYKSKGQFYEPD